MKTDLAIKSSGGGMKKASSLSIFGLYWSFDFSLACSPFLFGESSENSDPLSLLDSGGSPDVEGFFEF